ncbi:MAG TPA: hypothetical protein VGG10_10230 [Rhizomicrobium sp.]|jgi:hypothetical protein
MAAFEHITTLLSFVFALALTHLLASATDLILNRERVRFSWTQTIWMANAAILLLINWLSLYGDKNLREWDATTIGVQFLFTVLQYFTCSLVSPAMKEGETLDMGAFFERQKLYALGAIAALGVFAIAINALFWSKLSNETAIHFIADQVVIGVLLVITIAAMVVRPKWLQLVLAAVFTAGLLIPYFTTSLS